MQYLVFLSFIFIMPIFLQKNCVNYFGALQTLTMPGLLEIITARFSWVFASIFSTFLTKI